MFHEQKKIQEFVSAAYRNDLETIQKLAKKGVPLDAKNQQNGYTALRRAIEQGAYDVAGWLVENDVEVTQQDVATVIDNVNYSYSNKQQGGTELLELMAEKGADVSRAAELAARQGQIKLLGYAIEQGGDMKQALEAAALRGHEEAVCLLTDKNAEVTEEAVRNAMTSGNQNIAELLGMMYGPEKFVKLKEEAAAWKERQRIFTEGTIEEKAQLKLKEAQEAALQEQERKEEGKRQRMGKLSEVVGELEKGLNVLKESPTVDFKFTTSIDEEREQAVIQTNISGSNHSLRLEVSASNPGRITEYTGNTELERTSYSGSSYRSPVTNQFNTASEAVSDVIEQAVQRNTIQPAKPAAARKQGLTR